MDYYNIIIFLLNNLLNYLKFLIFKAILGRLNNIFNFSYSIRTFYLNYIKSQTKKD